MSGYGRPEARGRVRASSHTLSLPWQKIEHFGLSQSEHLNTMLSVSNSHCLDTTHWLSGTINFFLLLSWRIQSGSFDVHNYLRVHN